MKVDCILAIDIKKAFVMNGQQGKLLLGIDERKLQIALYIFLLIAFAIALGQNYLKYGHSEHYKPIRSVTYLITSLILFVPFIPLSMFVGKKLKLSLTTKYHWLVILSTALLTISVFYVLASLFMCLLGFYDAWISVKFAKSYFGREAIWHLIALLVSLIYVAFQASNEFEEEGKKDDFS